MTDVRKLPDFESANLQIEPLARASTIPSSWYWSPEVHQLDQDHVLGKTWQYLGPEAWVRQPGECLPAEAAGNPVLVVRGKDQQLRAFYNVCRHRGGPISLQREVCKVLQCKYHGWTFQLDGSLRGIPRFRYVELFDRGDYGLLPLRVTTWKGMVFVNLNPEAVPLSEYLVGIAERIEPIRLEDLRFHSRVNYVLECNWKTYVDNFLEGYHVPYVHPQLCSVLDYAQYETETADFYSVQSSPIQEQDSGYGTPGGTAFYYCIFPNFMLNLLPGRMQINWVAALGPERCQVVFDYYYSELEGEKARARIAVDMEYGDRVQQEDMEICAYVQKGLRSKGYDRGRFSVECEAAVHHFQKLLKQQYSKAIQCGKSETSR